MDLGHFVVIGIVMMTMLTTGYAMSNQNSSDVRAAGGFMILGGIVAGLVMAGGLVYQLRKSARKWNLDRRLDELEIKEKELQVKDLEKKFREKEEGRREEQHTQQESHGPLRQPYQPPKTVVKEKKKTQPPKSPTQHLKPEEIFEEEHILETGGPVPDVLKKKEKSHQEQPLEKELGHEEYVRHVKIDPILRCLWHLYNSKEGFFLGQTEAARAIFEIGENDEVSGSRRQEVKSSMKELEHYGLITTTVLKGDARGKQLIEYKITQKGKDMMKRAIDERIKRWIDFVEKYKFEMKG